MSGLRFRNESVRLTPKEPCHTACLINTAGQHFMLSFQRKPLSYNNVGLNSSEANIFLLIITNVIISFIDYYKIIDSFINSSCLLVLPYQSGRTNYLAGKNSQGELLPYVII